MSRGQQRPTAVHGKLEVSSPPLATERQIDFLYQLARQIRGLGCQRMVLVAEHRYGHALPELSASEASSLIDLLKEVRSGTRPIADLLPEAAAWSTVMFSAQQAVLIYFAPHWLYLSSAV